MSKAVLVMDMPENCIKCRFSYPARDMHTGKYMGGCRIIQTMAVRDSTTKPNWCPFKQMPEKIAVGELDAMDNPKGYDCGYLDGWNGCIDVMCGEEKEDEKRDN